MNKCFIYIGPLCEAIAYCTSYLTQIGKYMT